MTTNTRYRVELHCQYKSEHNMRELWISRTARTESSESLLADVQALPDVVEKQRVQPSEDEQEQNEERGRHTSTQSPE